VRVRDVETALAAISPRLRDGDVLLLKASRGIALERVVDGLRAELGHGATR
jgi:UDP-N-acetylmuramyl pentapeptide synthase